MVLRLLGAHTAHGLNFDLGAVRDGLTQGAQPRVHAAATALHDTISVASLLIVGGGIVVLALLRHRTRTAIACALLLAGANVTSELLKAGLPGRAGVTQVGTHSFPSGHSTVALSIGLALILVAPAAARPTAAVVAAVYATAEGIALVVIGAHFPSDVAAGFCVATAWAAGAAAIVGSSPDDETFDWRVLGLLAAAVAAAVGGALLLRPGLVLRIPLHQRVVEAAVGIAGAAAVCVLAFSYAIAERSASTTRS